MINIEFWIIFALILFIIELVTSTFYLLSLGIGAVTAAVLNYLSYDVTTQLIGFSIVTIICIIISRPLSKKINEKSSDKKYNSQRLIGKKAKVTENINSEKIGKVIVDNETWIAVSDEELETDEIVEVIDIDSSKLVVKRNY